MVFDTITEGTILLPCYQCYLEFIGNIVSRGPIILIVRFIFVFCASSVTCLQALMGPYYTHF